MQLPREKPGEALAPAVGVRAGLGAGMYLSQLLPSGEFRESPGWAAAAAVAWPGAQGSGSTDRCPGGEKGGGGSRSPAGAAPGGRAGSGEPRQPENSTDSRSSPIEEREGAILRTRIKSPSVVSGALGDGYKPG